MANETRQQDLVLGLDWRATIASTLVAALSFLIIFLGLAPSMGLSPFEPIQMMGAILLGRGIVDQPPEFDATVFGAALIIHFILSLLYSAVIAAWVRERPPAQALGVGMLIGLAIYMLNFYVFIPAYPWFYAARDLVTIFAHLVFGAAAALVYVLMTRGWEQAELSY
jgi:uncharacterized membrane protein YagU involved in acid resistance